MRVLLVGAGAVGQVYGRHLDAGGAEVAFFVKEKYAQACRAGFTLYPLRRRDRRDPERWEGVAVLTTLDEVAAQSWDQLWLCVSSTAMRAGTWLEELIAVVGDAILVTLQPGLDERAWLAERFPPERTVAGVITFIAYQAPLDGEEVPEPGIAYVFPPLQKSPFSGPADAVSAITSAFHRGGLPAAAHRDAARWAADPTAIMMPHLAALEEAGWSFRALSRSGGLVLAASASREALVVTADHFGERPPFVRFLIRPWLLRLVLWVAPKLMPFDLETYIRYHFTKVGDQTRYLLRSIIARGQQRSLPIAASTRLLAQLDD